MDWKYLIMILFVGVESRLQTAQIFFRHGQRFPTSFLTFPTDTERVIAAARDYDRGELTNVGIAETYTLGNNLREYYGSLVGRTYRSANLVTYSGRDNRTVASALAVLAGLFPPSTAQSWNRGLLWIPIPVFSLEQLDEVSFGILDLCPHYRDSINGTRVQALFDRFKEVAVMLSHQTGVSIHDIDSLQKVIDGVLARENLADYLPLPKWAKDDPLLEGLRVVQNIMHQEYIEILGHEPGAWHFDRLVGAFDDFVHNQTAHKLVFYSAHDTNMMTLGQLLNISVVDKTLQPLATYLAFELHSDDENTSDYCVKIYLHPQLNGTRERLHMTNCPDPCSYSKFRTLGSRLNTSDFSKLCDDLKTTTVSAYGTAAGVLMLVSVLLLTALISTLCSCQKWKKRYEQVVEEERRPLIVPSRL